MPCRCDEVEQSMNTIILEPWITLDSRLFSKDIIILTLEVLDNLGKAEDHIREKRLVGCINMPIFVVDLVSKSGSVHHGERDTSAFFV